MNTKITIYTVREELSDSVDFSSVQSQLEYYFNKFGTLPQIGTYLDYKSDDVEFLMSVYSIEYYGEKDGNYRINIGVDNN